MVGCIAVKDGDGGRTIADDHDGVFVAGDGGGTTLRIGVLHRRAGPHMTNDPYDDRVATGDLALQILVSKVVNSNSRQAVIAQIGGNRVSVHAVGIGGNLPPHAVNVADKAGVRVVGERQFVVESDIIDVGAVVSGPIDSGTGLAVEGQGLVGAVDVGDSGGRGNIRCSSGCGCWIGRQSRVRGGRRQGVDRTTLAVIAGEQGKINSSDTAVTIEITAIVKARLAGAYPVGCAEQGEVRCRDKGIIIGITCFEHAKIKEVLPGVEDDVPSKGGKMVGMFDLQVVGSRGNICLREIAIFICGEFILVCGDLCFPG